MPRRRTGVRRTTRRKLAKTSGMYRRRRRRTSGLTEAERAAWVKRSFINPSPKNCTNYKLVQSILAKTNGMYRRRRGRTGGLLPAGKPFLTILTGKKKTFDPVTGTFRWK